MPELPEVETIKKVLKPHLVGRAIIDVIINNRNVVAHPDANDFAMRLRGQTFYDFTRRGKFLTLTLTNGDSIVLHLRMTGCLTIEPIRIPCEKHTHVVFLLDDGNELRYDDIRRFGKFWLIEKGEPDTLSGIDKLGPEPFDLTPDYLKAKLCKSKKPLKGLLMDQSIIAGIGNIYSDEICFSAKILPQKAGNELTESELLLLCRKIPDCLKYFIEKNEISFDEYMLMGGRHYRNTPYLQVYGKAKNPCPMCGEILIGNIIGGRSSVYCKRCQK